MTKSKRIKVLENRLNDLEIRLNTLFSAETTTKSTNKEEPTYEEVINEWLCGKEIH